MLYYYHWMEKPMDAIHVIVENHECTYEVIIMKIDKNEDGEFLIPVEDDDELEKALKSSWI